MSISFYVLRSAGILLYSQQVINRDSFKNRPSPLLIAGFFSAIEHFAKEFVNGDVDTVEMGDYKLRFSFNPIFKCIFCLVHHKTGEEEKYKHLLNILKLLFIHHFKSEIKNKSANLTKYKKFDIFLDIILEAFEIKKEILQIEHFPCGFLGELRDFHCVEGLQCPKCQVLLEQEGIDYRVKLNKR